MLSSEFTNILSKHIKESTSLKDNSDNGSNQIFPLHCFNKWTLLSKTSLYNWKDVWLENIVFLRQFVDVKNPFIGYQQNWSKHVNNLKSTIQFTLK